MFLILTQKMYILALDKQYGYESVLYTPDCPYKSGDVFFDAQNGYLCLGDTLVFPELYKSLKPYALLQPQLLAKSFFSEKTLNSIHRMVHTYFSSYKNVVALFLPFSREFFTKKLGSIKKKKDTIESQSQSLFLFPDLRTLTQHKEKQLTKEEQEDIYILHGGTTMVQKRNLYQGVKNTTITKVFATNRGLFFERANLQTINIIKPHMWAFSAKSDPRFVLLETATHMAETYGAKIVTL